MTGDTVPFLVGSALLYPPAAGMTLMRIEVQLSLRFRIASATVVHLDRGRDAIEL